MGAIIPTRTLQLIVIGCTSRRATITRHSRRDQSGSATALVSAISWYLSQLPWLGGVFGDSTGIAPGYVLSLSYKWIELSTQGEYFIDATTRDNTFSTRGLR